MSAGGGPEIQKIHVIIKAKFENFRLFQGQLLQEDISFAKPAGQVLVAHIMFLPGNQVKRPYLKK